MFWVGLRLRTCDWRRGVRVVRQQFRETQIRIGGPILGHARRQAVWVDLPSLDRLGGKAVWMGALALFLLGSVGASLAWNAPSLVACRVVQGIGAA